MGKIIIADDQKGKEKPHGNDERQNFGQMGKDEKGGQRYIDLGDDIAFFQEDIAAPGDAV